MKTTQRVWIEDEDSPPDLSEFEPWPIYLTVEEEFEDRAILKAELAVREFGLSRKEPPFPKLSYEQAVRILNSEFKIKEDALSKKGVEALSKLFKQPFFICGLSHYQDEPHFLLVLEDAGVIFVRYGQETKTKTFKTLDGSIRRAGLEPQLEQDIQIRQV